MFRLLLFLLLISHSLKADLIDQDLSGAAEDQEFKGYAWQDYIKPDNDAYIKNLLAEVGYAESSSADPVALSKIPDWLVESSLANMPLLLCGIFNYLKFHDPSNSVTSCHRFILVGKPGVGKTTLAQAIAHSLGYRVEFVHASSLFGRYRNHTAINLLEMFDRIKREKRSTVLIIDEIHKLFENHEEDKTDDAANATAFWNQLDEIEKHNPNIIVIGTANSVDRMPSELKSRFHGKIIEMPLPDLKQRYDAFKAMLINDSSIKLGLSLNDDVIVSLNKQFKNQSLRDVQLLIDTAKMFKYAELRKEISGKTLVLQKRHFEKAADILRYENRERWLKKMEPTFQKFSAVTHTVAELGFIMSLLAAAGKVGAGYFVLRNW